MNSHLKPVFIVQQRGSSPLNKSVNPVLSGWYLQPSETSTRSGQSEIQARDTFQDPYKVA